MEVCLGATQHATEVEIREAADTDATRVIDNKLCPLSFGAIAHTITCHALTAHRWQLTRHEITAKTSKFYLRKL